MSDFHLNNSKLPRNDRFTQQIGAKARPWSSFGQIDRPFHSLSRGGPARLSEPRNPWRGGGSRFSIAAPGYNGYRLAQNSAIGPMVVHVWFWAFAMSLALIVLLLDFS